MVCGWEFGQDQLKGQLAREIMFGPHGQWVAASDGGLSRLPTADDWLQSSCFAMHIHLL